MGTIVGSSDPRAQSLLQDLSRDPLALQIIHKIDHGPFGPKGSMSHPFGSTKEDFLASIMRSTAETASEDGRKNSRSQRAQTDSVQGRKFSSHKFEGLKYLYPCRRYGLHEPQQCVASTFEGITHAQGLNCPRAIASVWWWQKRRLLASEHIVSVLSVDTNLASGFHFTNDSTCAIAASSLGVTGAQGGPIEPSPVL
jgi:hypothetical protein